MNQIKISDGSVTTPLGFQACGIRCGIKQQGSDLALIVSEVPATVAALFTSNRMKAAPILVSQDHVRAGMARAIVINSGNANACTGPQGLADARTMTQIAGRELHIDPSHVLVASTGVIGHYLPMELIEAGIVQACHQLSPTGGIAAAQAIMTTDTRPKHFAVEFDI
ncbi:MAG: bifunctional ornithine acetyltransferase/N-acetylglutamate synthase, partial [candidate division KSB1 bacterium]|nr:bifunctional ornithine acetyltransferase/N-acetylglutamate synthase [candidate division KSB1 bacterium]